MADETYEDRRRRLGKYAATPEQQNEFARKYGSELIISFFPQPPAAPPKKRTRRKPAER